MWWALFFGIIFGSYNWLAGVLAFLLSLYWQDSNTLEKITLELKKSIIQYDKWVHELEDEIYNLKLKNGQLNESVHRDEN